MLSRSDEIGGSTTTRTKPQYCESQNMYNVDKRGSSTHAHHHSSQSRVHQLDHYLNSLISPRLHQVSRALSKLSCLTQPTTVPRVKSTTTVKATSHSTTPNTPGNPSIWVKLTTIILLRQIHICTVLSSGTVLSKRKAEASSWNSSEPSSVSRRLPCLDFVIGTRTPLV